MDSEIESLRQEASDRLETIAELQKHTGWQLFQVVLDQTIKSAQFHLEQSKDPSEAWRYLAELRTARSLKSWTDREIEAAKGVLEDTKKR